MQRVAIFGATSAIAAEVAALYAERGARLFLVGRNAEKLERLRERLGASVEATAQTDLDDTSHSAALVKETLAVLGGLDVAIIAHGLLGDQLETERSWDAAEAVLRTNLLSPISLVIPLANALEEQGHGHLAVLSSVAGERGRPRNFTYGAAKGALTIYLQGLRSRLWGRGVSISTIKLGPVDTPMTATHAKNPLFAKPGPVARRLVAHLDQSEGALYLPWYWAPIMGVVRRLPEPLFQRFGFLSGR